MVMNGFLAPLPFDPAVLAASVLATINWLWVLGGIAAAWLVLSAMSRHRIRLTELLRLHVKKTQDANLPPNPAPPTDDSNS